MLEEDDLAILPYTRVNLGNNLTHMEADCIESKENKPAQDSRNEFKFWSASNGSQTLFCCLSTADIGNSKSSGFNLPLTSIEKTSKSWLKQWEIKCREWLYQDKFNIEIVNFAKKNYIL